MSIPMPDREAMELRLRELLVDEFAGELAPEDIAELEQLRDQVPNAPAIEEECLKAHSELIVRSARNANAMPASVRDKLLVQGQALVSTRSASRRRSVWVPVLAAASVVLAASAAFFAYEWSTERRASQSHLADLADTRARNAELLADAQRRVDELTARVATADAAQQDLASQLAENSARALALAQALDAATRERDEAQLRIAQLEAPIDPATIAADRRKLLEVPETIRIAWQPFDLPDAPAEQRDVSGDVVWNDRLEQGYLRFVGLKPNDPNVEQYQVWVIDERGMEQKVSGGVFNATADGEVIVPIHPGIDIRRVAIFAVTVEEPGGTWVPDLRRRVVVAPRG